MDLDGWDTCPLCGGDEGHHEGDEWVPCSHCDGQGGWPQLEGDTIDRIEKTRAGNNVEWMMILRIALEEAPERTKPVLRRIEKNDAEIHEHLKQLGEE